MQNLTHGHFFKPQSRGKKQLADAVILLKLNLCLRRTGPWPTGQGLPISRACHPALAPHPHVTVPSDTWCQTAGPSPVRGAPPESSLPCSFFMSFTKLKYDSVLPGDLTRENGRGAESPQWFFVDLQPSKMVHSIIFLTVEIITRIATLKRTSQKDPADRRSRRPPVGEAQLTCLLRCWGPGSPPLRCWTYPLQFTDYIVHRNISLGNSIHFHGLTSGSDVTCLHISKSFVLPYWIFYELLSQRINSIIARTISNKISRAKTVSAFYMAPELQNWN